MVVLAGSRELLDAALERADGGDGLSEDDFDKGLEGLPDDALARVYVDVQGLLGQSEEHRGGAQDRVGRRAAHARPDRLGAEAARSTSSSTCAPRGDLTDEDLPLASGDEAAKVVQRPSEIGVGLRDPSQLVAFFESALQAVDPQTFGDYEQGKRALSAKLDLDIDKDVIAQLTGNLSVSATIDGEFGVRAEVKDPAAFAKTVDKVAEALPELGSGGQSVTAPGRPLRGSHLGRRDVRVRRGRRRACGGHGRRPRPRARRGRAGAGRGRRAARSSSGPTPRASPARS